MADLNRLTKLFEAISSRNWNSANAIASEVANAEELIGHHSAAQRLRGALHSNGNTPGSDAATVNRDFAQPSGSALFLSSALTLLPAEKDIADIRLRSATRAQLQELIVEWTKRDELAAHHIERRTKLLFHGPPGCGKSVTARALGRALELPVYVVRFDAVVGAYLGQTALHLRQLFRFAETTHSVVLIDEIDALGKRRGNPLDVGELDRVVIALLQELEHSHPQGLLIATSNLARQLDDALWRRFDLVLEFPKPTVREMRSFSIQHSKARRLALTRRLREAVARAKSYADIERIIDAEERRLVLRTP